MNFLEDRQLLTTAVDMIPPGVMVTATPNVLWPPNGKLETVVVSGITSDNPGGSGVNPATLSFHVLDEYGTDQPSGAIPASDIAALPGGGFEFSFSIQLQASRFGFDRDGHQYAIAVTDADFAGNVGQGFAFVTVPHDRGHAPVFGFGSESITGPKSGPTTAPVVTVPGTTSLSHGGRHGHGHNSSNRQGRSQLLTSGSSMGSGTPIGVIAPGMNGDSGGNSSDGHGHGHGNSGDNGHGNGNGNGNGHGNGHGGG